jgi:purine-binding chemotaxis protein CheW
MNALGVSSAVAPPTTSPGHWLLCQTGDRLLAIPLSCVVETMRPLALRAFPGAARFILGVAVIRGVVVPVIDVRSMLEIPGSTPARFVTLRVDGRTVALAVDRVFGVRTLDGVVLHDLPPLLGALDQEAFTAIGTLDSGLLLVLGAARLVPEAVWPRIDELAATLGAEPAAAGPIEPVSTS